MIAAAEAHRARRAAEEAARSSYGKLVAILTARSRDIAGAEDALSEALVAALAVWPERGVPANPEAWLLTAARNRMKNETRALAVRRRAAPEIARRLEIVDEAEPIPDERLRLMLVCAHPAIDASTRTPLILQTVLGLDAVHIARVFLSEPAAMSQRLVRAKAKIRDAGLRFEMPEPEAMPARLGAVLDAIYAAFGQGWDGRERPDWPDGLTGEAIWLARLVVALLPTEPEPKGLLALMLYCSARRAARRDAEGRFVPLDQQDARLWDRAMIIEAEGLLAQASRAGLFGRYQCEAAIQSVHIQRPVTGRLNLAALRTLYELLLAHGDSIGARLGHAVVLAQSGEAPAALAALDALAPERVARHQPYWVSRGLVLENLNDADGAAAALREAIRLTEDASVRAHLLGRLAALRDGPA